MVLNNLLRREGHIPGRCVGVLYQDYGIAKSQCPPSSRVDAELCVHAAYNDAFYTVLL